LRAARVPLFVCGQIGSQFSPHVPMNSLALATIYPARKTSRALHARQADSSPFSPKRALLLPTQLVNVGPIPFSSPSRQDERSGLGECLPGRAHMRPAGQLAFGH